MWSTSGSLREDDESAATEVSVTWDGADAPGNWD
jgi:hypothetical protein